MALGELVPDGLGVGEVDGLGGEPVGGVPLLPSVGDAVGDEGDGVGVGVAPGEIGGADRTIAAISPLNVSSWAAISVSEYAVMPLPELGQPVPDLLEREQLLLSRCLR